MNDEYAGHKVTITILIKDIAIITIIHGMIACALALTTDDDTKR